MGGKDEKQTGRPGDAGRSRGGKDPATPARLACPFCGSARTQPFPHAGPGARVNMRCMDCGHLFKDKDLRR